MDPGKKDRIVMECYALPQDIYYTTIYIRNDLIAVVYAVFKIVNMFLMTHLMMCCVCWIIHCFKVRLA